MRIGIVGTGNMGRALGFRWAQGGHQVLFGSVDHCMPEAAAAEAGPGAQFGDRDSAGPRNPPVASQPCDRLCARGSVVSELAHQVVVGASSGTGIATAAVAERGAEVGFMSRSPRTLDEPGAGFTGWVSALARTHTRGLASVARTEGLGSEDALDAVQEAFRTFLLLPQARSLVESPEDSAKILAVLVRNAARNMRRRRHRALPHEPLARESDLEAHEPSADELIARAEEHVRLVGCVSHLSEIQQQVVRLRALQEMSGHQTAALLGIPPERVAVHLQRAKKALLACLLG